MFLGGYQDQTPVKSSSRLMGCYSRREPRGAAPDCQRGASAARTSALPGHESSPLDRIRPAGLLRPLFVAWLLLSAFVTHDA